MNSKLRRAVMVAQVEEQIQKTDILLVRVCFSISFLLETPQWPNFKLLISDLPLFRSTLQLY